MQCTKLCKDLREGKTARLSKPFVDRNPPVLVLWIRRAVALAPHIAECRESAQRYVTHQDYNEAVASG